MDRCLSKVLLAAAFATSCHAFPPVALGRTNPAFDKAACVATVALPKNTNFYARLTRFQDSKIHSVCPVDRTSTTSAKVFVYDGAELCDKKKILGFKVIESALEPGRQALSEFLQCSGLRRPENLDLRRHVANVVIWKSRRAGDNYRLDAIFANISSAMFSTGIPISGLYGNNSALCFELLPKTRQTATGILRDVGIVRPREIIESVEHDTNCARALQISQLG